MKNKIMKKLLCVAMVGALVTTPSMTAGATRNTEEPVVTQVGTTNTSELPPKILQEKKDFDTIQPLFDQYKEMDERNVETYDLVNGDSKVRRINFQGFYEEAERPIIEPGESMEFEIPAAFIRTLRLFSDIRFEADFAANMHYDILEPDGKGGFNEYTSMVLSGGWPDKDTGIQVNYAKVEWLFNESDNKDARFLKPEEHLNSAGEIDWSGYKIRVHNKSEKAGKLRSIFLWEETGIDKTYDTTAYTVMGGHLPILDVEVAFDASKNLSLDGETKLDEVKFKTFHTNSGPLAMTDGSDAMTEMDQTYAWSGRDYNFYPGRGVYHFDTDYSGLQNAENPDKEGFADYSVLDTLYKIDPVARQKYDRLFPTIGNQHVLTFDFWPSYMWYNENLDREANGNGSPAVDKFDAAAELAGEQVAAFDEKFGTERVPKYIEVKNESTISAEWPYFIADGDDKAWDLLGDFHNKVADEVKAKSPDKLVGGPSTAFLYLEKDDFKDARYHMNFMDDTKDHLDFYSHHFYENSRLIVNDPEAPLNPDGYLNGRFEGVMDLLVNHMEITDNVKPIVITEAGSYNATEGDIGAWHKLKATNGYLLRFMNMPQTIDVFTPYLYPIINWNRNANNAFYKYESTSGTQVSEEMTLLESYIDLWKDYRGAYIPVETDNDFVYTNATRHGDTVYVAVTNMNPQRVNIDLTAVAGGSIGEVTRKHVYLEKGKLTYEEETVANPEKALMRVEETGIFEIKLNNAKDMDGTVERSTDYGNKTLLPTGVDANFRVEAEVADKKPVKSVLRVHFGKDDMGFAEDLDVTVNGTKLEQVDLEYTNKQGSIFTYEDIALDPSIIKATNDVVVNIPEEAGYITSVQIFNYYENDKTPAVETDVKALEAAVADAKELLASVKVSATGGDVANGEYWTTEDDQIGMHTAIHTAEAILADTQARTAEEVAKALTDLERTMEIFEKYIKRAVDPVKFPVISFEDAETKENISLAKENATIEYVSGDGVAHGDKALKYTITGERTDSNDWDSTKSSHLVFTAPEGNWDLTDTKGNTNLSYTLHNPGDKQIQIRLLLTDVVNTTGLYFTTIQPGETIEVKLDNKHFEVQEANWVTGPVGLDTKALDTKQITSMKFCFYEHEVSDGASFIIDEIRVGTEEVEEENNEMKISFEDGETHVLSLAKPDTASYEIITSNGVTDGSKALQYTLNTQQPGEDSGDNWNSAQNSHIIITPEASGVWNLDDGNGAANLQYTLTNTSAEERQIRTIVTDKGGVTGLYFTTVAAGTTVDVHLDPSKFEKQDMDWTDGPVGLQNSALDTKNIASIKFCFEEKTAKAGDSFIVDHISNSSTKYEPSVPPVTFEKVTDLTMTSSNVVEYLAAEGTTAVTADVVPATATNKTVTWTMKNANATGAAITEDGKLTATAAGDVVVEATVANGLGEGINFTKEFTITIQNFMVSAEDITGVPSAVVVGETIELSPAINTAIQVAPETATSKEMTWSIIDAGTTGAVLTGTTITTTADGVLKIKASIENGKYNLVSNDPYRIAYEKEFAIAVGEAEVPDHVHTLVHHPRVEPTCCAPGNIEYWSCAECNKNFSDAEGKVEVTDVVLPQLAHELKHVEEIPATCSKPGRIEYWLCTDCNQTFRDAEGTKEVTNLEIPKLQHKLQHVAYIAPTTTQVGTMEHWVCEICGTRYADAEGTQIIHNTVIPQLDGEDNEGEQPDKYVVVEGNNQNVVVGDAQEVTFKVNGSLDKFVEVQKEGKALDKKHYTVEAGSVIVTLLPSYVQTLELGKHAFTVKFENGSTEAVLNITKELPPVTPEEDNEDEDTTVKPEEDGDTTVTPETDKDENEDGGKNPETGDATTVMPYILAMLCMAGLGFLIYRKRKEQ